VRCSREIIKTCELSVIPPGPHEHPMSIIKYSVPVTPQVSARNEKQ
jgi:hypothetical protein